MIYRAMMAVFAAFVAVAANAQSVEDGIAAFEREDYAAAVENWRPLAEAGDPEAQINLAGMYFHGLGVERDLVTAHKWCDIAAELLPEGHNRLLALRLRGEVALRLTEDEIAEAEARAAAWRAAADAD